MKLKLHCLVATVVNIFLEEKLSYASCLGVCVFCFFFLRDSNDIELGRATDQALKGLGHFCGS